MNDKTVYPIKGDVWYVSLGKDFNDVENFIRVVVVIVENDMVKFINQNGVVSSMPMDKFIDTWSKQDG